MTPFEFLNVATDADVPTIKRAYARLLRQHRPDEDPAGFQQCHDAYRICIAHAEREATRREQQALRMQAAQQVEAASHRDSSGNGDTAAETASSDAMVAVAAGDLAGERANVTAVHPQREPPPEDHADPATSPDAESSVRPAGQPSLTPSKPAVEADEPSPSHPARPTAPPPSIPQASPRTIQFPLADFVNALCQQDHDNVLQLQSWLERCEPLYALALKQAIIPSMLQMLAQRREPLSPDGLRVVLHFFALDTVGPERRAFDQAVLLLESRSRAAWSLRTSAAAPGSPAASSRRIKSTSRPGWLQRVCNRELTEPANFVRRAAILLLPSGKARMRVTVERLSREHDLSKDPMFARGGLSFWQSTLDRMRVSPWLALSVSLNIVAVALVVALIDNEWTLTGSVAYAIVGILCFSAWYATALSKARQLRKLRAPRKQDWRHRFVQKDLQLPRALGRRALILLVPGFKGAMRTVLDAHDAGRAGVLGTSSDEKARAFWRGVLDPLRVSRWRILAFVCDIPLLALIVGVASWDPDMATATIALGTVVFLGWLMLAMNDAAKARAASRLVPASARTGSVSFGRTRQSNWRWVIWAIIAINALIHAFASN